MAQNRPPAWSNRIYNAYVKYGEADAKNVDMAMRFFEAMIELQRGALIELMSDYYRIIKPHLIDEQGEGEGVDPALLESYRAWYVKTCEIPKHSGSDWPDEPYRRTPSNPPYLPRACVQTVTALLRRYEADAPIVDWVAKDGSFTLTNGPVGRKDPAAIPDEMPTIDVYLGEQTGDVLLKINQDIQRYLESGQWREDLGTEKVWGDWVREYNETRKDFITRAYKEFEDQLVRDMEKEFDRVGKIESRGRPFKPRLGHSEMLVRRWFGQTSNEIHEAMPGAFKAKHGDVKSIPSVIRSRTDTVARRLGFLPPKR